MDKLNLYEIDKIIELESYSLSGEDMINYGPQNSKILNYKQLTEYDNLDDALGQEGILILLYLTQTDNYGHWCCVFKRTKNIVCFFDSYGKTIDESFKFADPGVRKRNKEILPHLSRLLYNSGYNVEYNDHKLQNISKTHHIATCGRHVLSRLGARFLDDDDYYKYMFQKSKHDPDFIVTYLTKFIN